jgi:lysophospholipase L1-like esterase
MVTTAVIFWKECIRVLRIKIESAILSVVFFLVIAPAVCAQAPGSGDSLNCGKVFKIVVLGSSTAYGSGASPIDSSWVNKFKAYVLSKNAQSTVINLATLGLTTYHVLCPTGFVPPPNRPFPVDVDRNITKALTYNPDAIIINLPTNDIALGVPQQESKDNYERTMALADSARIPVWVTTTQPRNTLSPQERIYLMEFRDWTYQRFGPRAIDFWSDVANADGTINTFYSAGDNVHVNNNGHSLYYTRTINERILDSLCLRYSPVVCPGGNTLLNCRLAGSTYQWQVNTGSGFTAVTNGGIYTGAATAVLKITNAPGTLYGYQYRCLVNGNTFSNIFLVKIGTGWEGTANAVWENPANWSCGSLPDANTDVIINSGKPNYPSVNSNTTVRSLKLNTGATVNVSSGVLLTILK